MTAGRIRRARTYVTGSGLGPLLVRSVAGTGVVRVAAMVASFAIGVQLARLLGVEGYGYYGLALSIITIAGIPGELGIPKLVTREVAAAASTSDTARVLGVVRWGRWLVIRLSIAMAMVAIGAVVVVGRREDALLVTAVALGAPAIPLMALARVEGGALQGLHHIVRSQIPANLFRPLLLSAAVAAFYFLGWGLGVGTVMALYSATAALVLVITHLWLRNRLPPGRATRVETDRGWLSSSVAMALSDGVQTLQTEICILLLALVSGPAVVGMFRVASATAGTLGAAGIVMAQVALPITARLHAEKDHARLQRTVTALARGQLLGVLLLSLPLLIAPDDLIQVAFGRAYTPAGDAVRILACGQILNAAFGPTATLLNMTRHERRVTRAMVIALAVNAVALVPLARAFGLSGAALSVVLAILMWNLLTWLDARRLLGIETSAILAPLHKSLSA